MKFQSIYKYNPGEYIQTFAMTVMFYIKKLFLKKIYLRNAMNLSLIRILLIKRITGYQF